MARPKATTIRQILDAQTPKYKNNGAQHPRLKEEWRVASKLGRFFF